MRDLTETLINILIALVLIAATYYYLAGWLSSLVAGTFTNLTY